MCSRPDPACAVGLTPHVLSAACAAVTCCAALQHTPLAPCCTQVAAGCATLPTLPAARLGPLLTSLAQLRVRLGASAAAQCLQSLESCTQVSCLPWQGKQLFGARHPGVNLCLHPMQELAAHPASLAQALWGVARLSATQRWRPATPLLARCCRAVEAAAPRMGGWGIPTWGCGRHAQPSCRWHGHRMH